MTFLFQRYYLKEFLKVFFLVLFSFYFLYVLIDYSAHTKTFHQEGLLFYRIILYYLYQFTKQCEILVPVALLLATIKVLTTANLRGELVALLAGGIPFKTLTRPFFYVAGISAFLLYLNFQYLQPLSLNRLHTFEEVYFKEQSKEERRSPVHHLKLGDNSLLLYQSYDPVTKTFFDAYWIKSIDELYKIKTLTCTSSTPQGDHIEHVVRNPSGELVRKRSIETLPLNEMALERENLTLVTFPPKWQSLMGLRRNLPWKKLLLLKGNMSDREAECATFFFYKLLIPLACILACLAPIPFCFRFSRSLPLFFFYALSLFAIISFFTLTNASVILAESQVLPPFWTLVTPFILSFLFFGWRYAKL